MFERTLDSLIKGLRSHRGQDEPAFVATLLEEIRQEVRSGDMEIKAGAVLKLTYLQMLGYPCSHASFPILEVMASSQYHLKQVGYLAATRSFNQDTDVLILATNLVQKDLHSANPLEVAVALNGLSHIVTPELAQHLAGDIGGMLNHSKPAIRKKAILCLYTIIQHYPPALDQCWHRLQEKLEDSDPGVVSATVNIICELAGKDPKPFVALSPQLFQLLNTSTNNWMLIKLVKLFGALTPHESRLTRKLLPPIKALISTTPAMSLLYECITSVISGEMLDGPGGDELAEVCADKLAAFLDDEDRNLRYIALLALVRILPTHPHLVAQYQHLIFPSINDPDLSIRLRTLDLVAGMASRRNLQTIVSQLLAHLGPASSTGSKKGPNSATAALKQALAGISRPQEDKSSEQASSIINSSSYRLEVSKRILSIGASDTFANIDDFEWYLDILVRLAHTSHVAIGGLVRDQMIEIAARVRAVRPYAVQEMIKLLEDEAFLTHPGADETEILHAAAWICGEYPDSIENPRVVIPLLLQSPLLTCSPSTIAVCIQGAVKIFAHWLTSLSSRWNGSQLGEVKNLAALVVERLQVDFAPHPDCEVAERATEFLQLFQFVQKDLDQQKEVNVAVAAKETASSSNSSTIPPPPPADEATSSWRASADDGTVASSSKMSTPAAKGPKSFHLLGPLFQPSSFGPVAKEAQSKVSLPSNFDLSKPIIALGSFEVVGASDSSAKSKMKRDQDKKSKGQSSTGKSKERAKLASGTSNGSTLRSKGGDAEDLDDVPIVQLSLGDLPGFAATSKGKQKADESIERPDQDDTEVRAEKKKQKEALLIQEAEEMPEVVGPVDASTSNRQEKSKKKDKQVSRPNDDFQPTEIPVKEKKKKKSKTGNGSASSGKRPRAAVAIVE